MVRLGPLALRSLIAGEDSGGSLAAFKVDVRAGQKLAAPAHGHDGFEETIYGVEGVLTWVAGGQPIDVGPGQPLCIPRGVGYRFDNNGSLDAKVLCVITPAAMVPHFFRDTAAGLDAAAGGRPDPQWRQSCALTTRCWSHPARVVAAARDRRRADCLEWPR